LKTGQQLPLKKVKNQKNKFIYYEKF